jgi:FtsH-binding integral membrane protein
MPTNDSPESVKSKQKNQEKENAQHAQEMWWTIGLTLIFSVLFCVFLFFNSQHHWI